MIGEFAGRRYIGTMKQRPLKGKARRDWLLEECEKLRQECNKMTEEQRKNARQRALKIIYGTDATTPAGSR